MNQKILFGALGLIVAIGLVLLGLGEYIAGGIVTLIGAALLFAYWRLYRILRISEALGREDMETAKRYLDAIDRPEKLNDYSKTYYYFFRGMVDLKENSFREAEAAFKQSLETNRFRGVDEKASAHLMVGQLLLRKRNRQGAKRHMQEARSLTSNPQILEQIRSLAKQARIRL